MTKVLRLLVITVLVYLVARALVEPFLVDRHDPASYRTAWGGPSYPGVLAAHCLPGVVAAGVLALWWRRRSLLPDRPGT